MAVYGEGRKGVLVLGEAPGCISGDALIDTAFRNKSRFPEGVPIRDLVGKVNFFVYSFDTEKQSLALGKVRRVWKTGRKKVYLVRYEWRDWNHARKEGSIKVTSNHLFLLKRYIPHDPFQGWVERRDYLSIEEGLRVGHSLQPFYRYQIGGGRRKEIRGSVGIAYKDRVVEARFLTEFKEQRRLGRDNAHHIDENPLNDEWENLEGLTTAEHYRHHSLKSNVMHNPVIKARHLKVMKSNSYRRKMSRIMKRYLAKPRNHARRLRQIRRQSGQTSMTMKSRYRSDPVFYRNYLLGRQHIFDWTDEEVERRHKERFPDNHKIISIDLIGEEDVYDIEVEDYHNFAVNGIFVHNSTEDEQGRPFVGKSGQFLRQVLDEIGVNLDKDTWTTNALVCRPRGNATPDIKQIGYCRPNFLNALRTLQPRVVVTLGKSALVSALAGHWKGEIGALEKWVGWKIPLEAYWLCPTFHPAYLLRMKNVLMDRLFTEDLERAFSPRTPTPPQQEDFSRCIEILYDEKEICEAIKGIDLTGGWASVDYETNCIKPEWPESRIFSCAISNGERTISYPWVGRAVAATDVFLRSNRTRKIGANIKFEERWTIEKFGHGVTNWGWDTMLATHCLDNRTGICSLKFQAFVKMGVPSYNESVAPYLFSSQGPYNRIREIETRSLLLYGGIDALLEYRLAMLQRREFGHED